MVDIHKIETVYFVGIGGIGMSALARYFNKIGKKVYGYDRTETELTKCLTAEGIAISYEESTDLPQVFLSKNNDKILIVYTPAIPHENKILQQLSNYHQIYKRSQVLGFIAHTLPTLAIAGTHGKTTTSILLAHLFQSASVPQVAFLGGISKNFDSNLVLNKCPQFLVTEADEFDRSFLTLHPKIAVITSTDADHLDIYGNHQAMQQSYTDFAHQVSDVLITKPENTTLFKNIGATVKTYSVATSNADATLRNYEVSNGKVTAQFTIENNTFDVDLNYPGLHNAENTLAASYVAFLSGISIAAIQKGIATFQGVKRRFEFHVKTKKCVYVDDYAHHPTEIKATLSALKQLYPDRALTVAFQPHLFSRTNDFKQEFAQALNSADHIILLPIYPARELPIQGVSSQSIANFLPPEKVTVIKKDKLPEMVKKLKPELFVTLGAGDIDKEIPNITKVLKEGCYEK